MITNFSWIDHSTIYEFLIAEYWLKRLENRRNWFRLANESINSYCPDKSIDDTDFEADGSF